jgi:para-aminobenzoate synthetase/4-amino-4-deoxychorismate lyase
MIVDMVRNDLSRIASRGSVQVSKVCEVERYPHVWQMISEVSAHSTAKLSHIFAALFPAASITGAPKESTARIIREVECSPRNIYTGAMGVVSPEGRSWFNVAIRTALIDRSNATVEYGVGSGIVWDSSSDDEFRECIAKAAAVTSQRHHVALFETILWEPERGFVLLERHLSRLARSAEFLSFGFERNALTSELDRLCGILKAEGVSQRIRLTLSSDGSVQSEAHKLLPLASPYYLALAREPVTSSKMTLYHKTTDRSAYDTAEPEIEGAHDVLLWSSVYSAGFNRAACWMFTRGAA